MPFTAFHALVVLPLHLKHPTKFEVVSLSLSAMLMDLEMFPFGLDGNDFGHGIFHTYLVVLTVYALAIAIGVWLAIRTFKPTIAKLYTAFGFRVESLDAKFRTIWFSSIVGGFSHVFIDSFVHPTSVVFFQPFLNYNPFYINGMVEIAVQVLVILACLYSLKMWYGSYTESRKPSGG